jgi:hypothetical protein
MRVVIPAEPHSGESRNPVTTGGEYWIPGSRASPAPRNDNSGYRFSGKANT